MAQAFRQQTGRCGGNHKHRDHKNVSGSFKTCHRRDGDNHHQKIVHESCAETQRHGQRGVKGAELEFLEEHEDQNRIDQRHGS